MQENQEPKSESEGTSGSGVSEVAIRPMATPFKVSFQVPYEVLDEKFAAFWDTHSQAIMEALKGKLKPRKVKGGLPSKETRHMAQKVMPIGQLYGELLADMVSSLVAEDLLFVEGVSVYEFEPGKMAHVVGVVYYRPSLIMTGELNLACPAQEELDAQFQLDQRYQELQFAHRVTHGDYEGVIDDLCRVKVTISTTSGGSSVPDLSTVENWLLVQDIKVPAIHDQLIGKKVGDLLEASFAGTPSGGPEAECTSVIKVHAVEKFELPEVDDALAQKEGFDTLDLFNERFHSDFKAYQDNRLGSIALDHLMQSVINQSELPPIPAGWADIWLDRHIQDHVARFKGDKKKAMAAIGVSTEHALQDAFRGRVYSGLWSSLAANWLADQWGIVFKDNPSINQDLQAKARSVVKWIK